jgi:hypothetical protein
MYIGMTPVLQIQQISILEEFTKENLILYIIVLRKFGEGLSENNGNVVST